jgi:hypothetical protein
VANKDKTRSLIIKKICLKKFQLEALKPANILSIRVNLFY